MTLDKGSPGFVVNSCPTISWETCKVGLLITRGFLIYNTTVLGTFFNQFETQSLFSHKTMADRISKSIYGSKVNR